MMIILDRQKMMCVVDDLWKDGVEHADSKDLQRLHSHGLWRSGDSAGLDQLWDELEAEGLPLAAAQSLLLQIVRLKARHFAGA